MCSFWLYRETRGEARTCIDKGKRQLQTDTGTKCKDAESYKVRKTNQTHKYKPVDTDIKTDVDAPLVKRKKAKQRHIGKQ